MESLAPEIAPFGVRTMLVEPGFFRTELLSDESTKWRTASIPEYAATTRETVAAWKKLNGQQSGDPAKLPKALVRLASDATPPQRWPAGADAVETFFRRKPRSSSPKPKPIKSCPRH
jgi:NAD(P)-dependent dehydrogenase (short-subunit alcohol dehydrogenase family)